MSVALLSASDQARGRFKQKKKEAKQTCAAVCAEGVAHSGGYELSHGAISPRSLEQESPARTVREFGSKCVVMRVQNTITQFLKPLLH